MFSYEISEIFKNTYFEVHVWKTASNVCCCFFICKNQKALKYNILSLILI